MVTGLGFRAQHRARNDGESTSAGACVNPGAPLHCAVFGSVSPLARRWIAVAALVAGLLVTLRIVMPHVPRDVEVRVGLRGWRDGADAARRLTCTFEQDGEVVRTATAAFGGSAAPREWRQTMSLVPGGYRVTVHVESEARAASRATDVRVEPGTTVDLPAPPAE